MKASAKSGWLIPTGLLLLSILPLLGATHRVAELLSGAQITKENARFFAAPMPVIVHAISSIRFGMEVRSTSRRASGRTAHAVRRVIASRDGRANGK